MFLRLWIIAGLCLAASPLAYADGGLRLYKQARSRYATAKSISSWPVQRKEYLRAVSDFQRFAKSFPNHSKLADAYFNLGAIYQNIADKDLDRDTASRSLHFYRKIAKEYPKSDLADDALYGVVQVCEKIIHDEVCRQDAIAQIKRDYPRGDVVSKLNGETSGNTKALDWDGSEQAMIEDVATVRGAEAEDRSGQTVLFVRMSSAKDFTSNVLAEDLDRALPPRFYMDISNAHMDLSLSEPTFSSTSPIRRVRFGQNTKETVRVVLDLSPSTDPKKIQVSRSGADFALEILAEGVAPAVAAKNLPEKIVTQEPEKKTEAVSKVAKTEEPVLSIEPIERKKERFRIIIDPGHGGEDVGAKGRRGTLEKDVALAVSRKLRKVLEKKSLYEVYMTRDDDRFITLNQRTHMANQWKGDLFVSVHANASPKRSANGVSTYFLDNADDKESLRVAMRENISWTRTGDTAVSEDRYLDIMKASMIKNFHTVQSTDLARYVQKQMMWGLSKRYKSVPDLGVRSAQFYVLTGAEMPAVLVETSFISNPKEELLLRDSRYQWTLSEAIAQGIDRFFKSAREGDHAALYSR